MLEKSSEVVLSEEEKAIILGTAKLQKSAGDKKQREVPERFEGWYTKDELKRFV